METKQIDLTDAELDTLMAALDTATKAGGLQAAQVLLPVAAKLSQIRHPEQSPNQNGRVPETVEE
mgnify:CR=1 FL=1